MPPQRDFTQARGLRLGVANPPLPAQRNTGHPDPPPACVILHLSSGCPLKRMSRSWVQDDAGGGGGSGGSGRKQGQGRLYKSLWPVLSLQGNPPPLSPSPLAKVSSGTIPSHEFLGMVTELGVKGCNQPPILSFPPSGGGGGRSNGGCNIKFLAKVVGWWVGPSYFPPPFLLAVPPDELQELVGHCWRGGGGGEEDRGL